MRRQANCAVFALALLWLPAIGGAALHPSVQVKAMESPEPPRLAPTTERSSLIAETWRGTDRPLGERVEATRVRAFRLGSLGVEGAARWLLSSTTAGSAAERAVFAQRLAPELPAAHAAVAQVRGKAGDSSEALGAVLKAFRAMGSHLEARFWLQGSLLVIATASAIVGGLFFLFLIGARSLPGAAHDLGDFVAPAMPEFSRVALLASLVFLPLALGEGWAGLGLVLFVIAMAFGEKRVRIAALLAVVIFLVGLFPAAKEAGRNLVALGSDPVARAVYAISRDGEKNHDLALLERASNRDSLATRALAVRARLGGESAKAKRLYRELLDRRPHDPAILVNLANLHLESGESDRAIALYRRALASGPSATVLFNLAQAHARSFEVADFDRVMAQAQYLDPERVEALSKLGGEGFVMDVPISSEVLRSRFLAAAHGEGFADAVRQRVAPGLLGRGGPLAFTLFAVCGGVALLGRSRFEPSSRCRRCGSRICARCDGSVWNGRVCDSCHHLFRRPEATDIERRRCRLRELEERERRKERIGLAGAWLIPGMGGMRQGRPDRALIGVLLSSGAFFAVFWMDGVVPDPGLVGVAGPTLLGAVGLGLGLLYIGSLLGTLRVSRRVEP